MGVWHNFTDGKRYQGNLRQWIDDMKQWTWEEHTEMKTVEWSVVMLSGAMIDGSMAYVVTGSGEIQIR